MICHYNNSEDTINLSITHMNFMYSIHMLENSYKVQDKPLTLNHWAS